MEKSIKPGQMPSPPEFLIRPQNSFEEATYPTMIEEYVPAPLPQNIDYSLYQNVINDRKQAEMSYAEIYAQYVEQVTLIEKLRGKQKTFERFKERVRTIYARAIDRDESSATESRRLEYQFIQSEKKSGLLQAENEALKASNLAHSEAFNKLIGKVGQAEAQMEQADHQFQTLAEEFDNRGILLEEADRHIQGYRAQIAQLTNSIKDWQDKYAQMRDEKLLMESEVREIQIKEAGIAALNNELAMSATKAQKQIYELEDKLARETEKSAERIAVLEAELDRYQEQRRVEALIEKSKKVQEGVSLTVKPGEVIKNVSDSQETRGAWNGFYEKWNHIINELTTHSSPIGRVNSPETEKVSVTPQSSIAAGELISEAGELEII